MVEQIRTVADTLSTHDPDVAAVRDLLARLETELIPHEQADEELLVPIVARAFGGSVATAALSRTHAEIVHQVGRLRRLVDDLGDDVEPEDIIELRRLLYGLYAICRLHNSQEEENAFVPVSEPTARPEHQRSRDARLPMSKVQPNGTFGPDHFMTGQRRLDLWLQQSSRACWEAAVLVRELMTSPATSLRAGSRLEAAVQLLAGRHISAVPIVDPQDHVVGILSEADILRERITPDPRAHLRLVEEPAEPWHRLVDDVMTPDPVTVQETSDAGHVADLLADTGWKSLPVVNGRRLVGVISRSDLLRALTTPDVAIEERVVDDLARIGHEEWHVEVIEGVVTLRGPRPGRETRLAAAIAQTAPGVRRVVVVEQPAP
nr:CBS domain-containing protein [Terrabacter sp. MAHUQ-38]